MTELRTLRSLTDQSEFEQQRPLQREEIVVRDEPDDRPAVLDGDAHPFHIVDRQRCLQPRDLASLDGRSRSERSPVGDRYYQRKASQPFESPVEHHRPAARQCGRVTDPKTRYPPIVE